MEVSLAQSQTPQYQRDVVSSSHVAIAVAPVQSSQSLQTADANDGTTRAKVDPAQLLGITLTEQPKLTQEQTLKPYGVIMLPFREDDPATTRKL